MKYNLNALHCFHYKKLVLGLSKGFLKEGISTERRDLEEIPRESRVPRCRACKGRFEAPVHESIGQPGDCGND